MQPDQSHLSNLFERLATGTASPEELSAYFELSLDKEMEKEIKSLMLAKLESTSWTDDSDDERIDRVYKAIKLATAEKETKIFPLRKLWLRIATVAAVLVVIGTLALMLNRYAGEGQSQNFYMKNDIPAGKNGATLTLSNGRKIRLSATVNGKLAKEAGVSISKTAEGLVYVTANETEHLTQSFNTLSTANGEQYQITLPDHSKVWLNAKSSIKYPASFSGLSTRTVVLDGEAYFEIAKSYKSLREETITGHEAKPSKERIPFVVVTRNQEIKVLGTHFNVNAYGNEPVTRTTLVEGSISLSPLAGKTTKNFLNGDRILNPGQQASNNGNKIDIKEVNTDLDIAWKNGLFSFDQTPLEAVMRQISRWYDVEVIYENESAKQRTIGGTVTRYGNVSGILKAISTVGNVKFEVKGKTITVK